MKSDKSTVPLFPFTVPLSYSWLVNRGLVGFTPNTALQPWYFLPHGEAFSVTDVWKSDTDKSKLFAFARRQDCDDLACFSFEGDDAPNEVVVVHGWTPEGYAILGRYDSIWTWLKSVVDDIEAWTADGMTS
jgi:hypothetical protein